MIQVQASLLLSFLAKRWHLSVSSFQFFWLRQKEANAWTNPVKVTWVSLLGYSSWDRQLCPEYHLQLYLTTYIKQGGYGLFFVHSCIPVLYPRFPALNIHSHESKSLLCSESWTTSLVIFTSIDLPVLWVLPNNRLIKIINWYFIALEDLHFSSPSQNDFFLLIQRIILSYVLLLLSIVIAPNWYIFKAQKVSNQILHNFLGDKQSCCQTLLPLLVKKANFEHSFFNKLLARDLCIFISKS